MEHRGACSADNVSGDGAGVQILMTFPSSQSDSHDGIALSQPTITDFSGRDTCTLFDTHTHTHHMPTEEPVSYLSGVQVSDLMTHVLSQLSKQLCCAGCAVQAVLCCELIPLSVVSSV